MAEGLYSAWLIIWMFVLGPLLMVFVFGLILTSPLWIFLTVSLLSYASSSISRKLTKRN
ncbi:uncharacterized protein (DUF58 family) [Puniceicoccus vermicola]